MSGSGNTAGTTKLSQILEELNASGQFAMSVLADSDGLPIAYAAAPGQSADKESAVAALMQRVSSQAREQLGMAETNEIVVYDAAGRRLICRPLTINGNGMILAIIVPQRDQSYRRALKRAVEQLKQMWQ